MRRSLIVSLTACLLLGASALPVEAKKKPKKKPPVTFTTEGTIAIANPADFFAEAGLTRTEFLATCGVPASQGFDGFVIELPEEITAVQADVSVSGADVTGMHDLDMYFFDEACNPTGVASTEAADESGVSLPGTRYVLVGAFFGVESAFTFEAVESR